MLHAAEGSSQTPPAGEQSRGDHTVTFPTPEPAIHGPVPSNDVAKHLGHIGVAALVAGVLKTTIHVASFGAQVAAIPGLAAAVSVLKEIVSAIEKVHHNKEQCRNLVERSKAIVQVIELHWSVDTALYRTADLERFVSLLEDIRDAMIAWGSHGYFGCFIRLHQMSAFIEKKKRELDLALEKFNVEAHLRLQRMIDEVRQSLGPDGSFKAMLNKYAKDQEQLFVIMGELQKINREQAPGSADQAKTRGRILKVQSILGGALPDVNLSRAECQKVEETPSIKAKNHDIYEGLWMGNQKVALKVYRDIGNDADRRSMINQRITRQVSIWSQLRHEHIVTLYGVCTDDGPYPYLVMPWYPSNAVQYVKFKDQAAKLKVCLEAARGLQYLHSLARPIVHGNLRGSSILISEDERAVLSDFGLCNVAGTENSTSITTESMRWMSIEAQRGQRSPDVDTWAWAMTALELLSGKVPFHEIKMKGALALKIEAGALPKRENYDLEGSIDDNLWSILQACWREPQKRLSADEIVEQLGHCVADKWLNSSGS
ncbi:hypothetical protein BOTBODRAFT_143534 [Botryobasidium botryosum FD-172 SS1]|uniref:Protein kinase domain-containing protein n=1 Tax=Botryobasidium botryosum (strain FD-172 SS1) TaxID=930990 RepID=A0A067N3C5_BOTB1|nr:hypothetical protein BOTBODRAFT_143534 [Botryobasidium botryosum FD-172 SS1]